MRLIDADKLKKMRFSYGYNNDGELLVPFRDVMRAIDQAPTVEVVKQKKKAPIGEVRRRIAESEKKRKELANNG